MKEAEAVANSERFTSESTLGKLAANWPAARLIEIYSSLPGTTEVRKFKDRATAVSRIWKALQTFAESASVVAEEAKPEPTPEVTATPAEQTSEASPTETVVLETPFDAPVSAQTPDVAPAAAPATQKGHPQAESAQNGRSWAARGK